MKGRKEAILEEMYRALIKRRDALRKALAKSLCSLKELAPRVSGDIIDSILDPVEDEIRSQLAEVESRELSRIEYALEQMRSGCYGVCEGCGANIPMARLTVLPYSAHCIKCQRYTEPASKVNWSWLLSLPDGIKLDDL